LRGCAVTNFRIVCLRAASPGDRSAVARSAARVHDGRGERNAYEQRHKLQREGDAMSSLPQCTHAGVMSKEDCCWCNQTPQLTDTDRLEWLITYRLVVTYDPIGYWLEDHDDYCQNGYFQTSREAIDAAIKERLFTEQALAEKSDVAMGASNQELKS